MKTLTGLNPKPKKRVSRTGPSYATTPKNAAVAAKWGDAIRSGFQLLPDVLIKNQQKLELNPTDLVVIINLTMHWWYPAQKPYPRSHTIASRMGVDVRTVQRTFEKLRNLNLVQRKKEGDSTVFDLDGLVDRLSELARADASFRARGSTSEKSIIDAIDGLKA